MSWQQCLISGTARKTSVDKEMAKSLLNLQDSNIKSQDMLELNEITASSKFSLSYDAIRELLEAISILKGYKIYNHECYTYFIKEILKDDEVSYNFDEFRKKRNSVKYYGEKIDPDQAMLIINNIKKDIAKLKAHLYPNLRKIIIISAVAENKVIGNNNTIPWHIPEDFKLFKKYTEGNVIIYGRKTFESLGSKTLPKRHNIVVTRQKMEGIECYPTLKEAIEAGKNYGKDIFLCGGARIYEEGLEFANKLYLSHVKGTYEGDTKFPEFSEKEWTVSREEEFEKFTFKEYERTR